MAEELVTSETQVLRNTRGIKGVLHTSEVALWLEGYDDIFSDFDPRPYAERALSDDFLQEAMRATRDIGNETFELKFLLAPKVRNRETEEVVRKRLHEHFQKHHNLLEKQKRRILKIGVIFILFGVAVMFLASVVAAKLVIPDLWRSFVLVVLEPAGWYLFWEGSNRMVDDYRAINPKLTFYHKMARSNISFLSF